MTPQFDHYETEGRTLYCEFKCRRCGTTYMRPLKECVPNDEGARYLRNTNPPPRLGYLLRRPALRRVCG